MDYDKGNTAASYDAGRSYSPQTLAKWMDVVAASVAATTVGRIVDLGCGRGRYSGALAQRFATRVVALDRSQRMLAQVRRQRPARAFGTSALRQNRLR